MLHVTAKHVTSPYLLTTFFEHFQKLFLFNFKLYFRTGIEFH